MPFDRQRGMRKSEPAVRRMLRENIRNRRLECRLSQREMGERIGVVQQWVQQIESPRGDNIPSLYQLEEIALHLGTTPADLLSPGRFRGQIGANDDLRKRQPRKA